MNKITEFFNPRFTTEEFETSFTRDHKTYEVTGILYQENIIRDREDFKSQWVKGYIWINREIQNVMWNEYGKCYKSKVVLVNHCVTYEKGERFPDGDLIRPHYMDNETAKRIIIGLVAAIIIIVLTSII